MADLIYSRFSSFRNAINGLSYIFRREKNFMIHLIIASIAILIAFWLSISSVEWCILLFATGLVLCFEILNTAVERTADLYSKEHNPLIGRIKDISAAGVLLAAFFAALIGAIIFIPKIIELL